MQLTLEEVEFSASEGTRVFSPDHEKKLDELRAAQIALAQAWARSEADEAIETVRLDGQTGVGASSAGLAPGEGTAVGATTEGGKSTVGSGSVPPTTRPGSSGLGITGTGAGIGQDGKKSGAGAAEQETEVDILLARMRREANDRYFQRVNQGVLDVVAKLEEVAVAMRAVEAESKEVWDDGGDEEDRTSVPGSSKT